MNYRLTVIKNPKGTFSYVGSVPIALGVKAKPSLSDVMAGRVYTEDGITYTTKLPVFATREEALNHASKLGFTAY